MGLTVTLYKPIKKSWKGDVPPEFDTIKCKEGLENLFKHFSPFIYEFGELEFNLGQALEEKGLNKQDLLWIATKKNQYGFPMYQFVHKKTTEIVKVDDLPMSVTAYKQIYAVPLETIRINDRDIHSSYTRLKRQGMAFILKTDLIKEVADFFPAQILEFSRWWDGTSENQFKNGETFVYFN